MNNLALANLASTKRTQIATATSAILAAVILAAPTPTRSQTVCPDCSTMEQIQAYLASQAAQPPAVQGANATTIYQTGNGNSAKVDVSSYFGTGSYYSNTTSQTQNGNNNSSNLRAVGNSNALTTNQTGDNNTSSITVYGSNNVVTNTQTNTQPGTPGLSYSLQRVGNGPSISVTQTK